MNNIKYHFTTIADGNIAYHVHDSKENVDKNRQNLADKYDFKLSNLKILKIYALLFCRTLGKNIFKFKSFYF